MSQRSVQWYGWKPDAPDHRDFKYKAVLSPVEAVPDVPEADLTHTMPPIQDQGDVGTCTAHAAGAAIGHNLIVQKRTIVAPSRLFAYYNARSLEGTQDADNGATLRDMVSGLAARGYCPEEMWPYDPVKVNDLPDQISYEAGLQNKIRIYARLNDLSDMLMCLAAGYPFVFGFTVFSTFESDEIAKSGILDMPKAWESPVGGHAVCAVGYDIETRRVTVRNSWGIEWGQKGHFTMPFDYLTNRDLSDDFWTIRF
jgi:C1A family cysteine protease